MPQIHHWRVRVFWLSDADPSQGGVILQQQIESWLNSLPDVDPIVSVTAGIGGNMRDGFLVLAQERDKTPV